MYLNRYRASVSALYTLSFISTTYAAPQVRLGNTTVVGVQTTANQEFFGGIPFAEPPIGSLRFANPTLKTSLAVETFNATQLGPACLQPHEDGGLIPPPPMSEDCLTINIFRPAGIPSNASLPVMAWIYGGGFIGGSTYVFNGSDIISQSMSRGTPVIYINFNYRLGPLGFPQGSEAMRKGALNLGLKDQIMALEWIQQNIHAFGGDKSMVTLFGESAGSISISALLLNQTIGSVIRGAILESGIANSPLLFNATRRQSVWDSFVQAVPACASVLAGNAFDCLRNASSADILNASAISVALSNEQFPWVPVIDGRGGLIPALPSELYAQGAFSRVPFIAGTNLDEGTAFTPPTINSSETIREWIITNHTTTNSSSEIAALGAAADRLLELYPDNPALGSPFNTGNETFGLSSQFKRLSAINGDLHLECLRRLSIQAASNNSVKAFGYLFTEPPPNNPFTPAYLGVFHGSEQLYIYPNILLGLFKPKPKLSSWMIDYWVSFATSLDPNDGRGVDRPQWKQYTPANQELLQLNDINTTMIPDNYRAEQIDFINSHSELFRH